MHSRDVRRARFCADSNVPYMASAAKKEHTVPYLPIDDKPGPQRDALAMLQVRKMIQSSIQLLWGAVPSDQNTLDEIEKSFRQVAAEVFEELRSDTRRLGGIRGSKGEPTPGEEPG